MTVQYMLDSNVCLIISTLSVLMEILADKDKEEIIQQFRAEKVIQGIQMIDIDRMSKSMLNQLMRIYKNPGLSIRKVPDISFTGETAADVGGPTREFFHVAIDLAFSCFLECVAICYHSAVWMPFLVGAFLWLANY